MSIVTFDPKVFKKIYPTFDGVENAVLTDCFNGATMHCNNTDNSTVQDVTVRSYLLNLLTAHIAVLRGVKCGDGVAPVGRISSATEGSVSADMDYMKATPGTGPWYQQTQYGAEYWQATSKYRGFKYRIRQTIPW